ncbi:MAG: LamG domain-containing protein [Verrucomicrobia bacterium]|nr:LamG domain-containing protein [Verrucomicrobiota bacterium]
MTLGFWALTGGAFAAEPAAAATPIPLTEDADTEIFHGLNPEDGLKVAGQPLEFAPGLTKGFQTLWLKPTEEKQTGVSFNLKPYLMEGTVEIWFYPDEDSPVGSNRCLVNLGTAGNAKWRIELRTKGLIGVAVSKEKTFHFGSAQVAPNQWHHAALTWSPEKTAKLYLDGEQVAESESSLTVHGAANDYLTVGDTPDWSQELGYGWHWSTNNFVGRLAYLRVSRVARKEFKVFKK